MTTRRQVLSALSATGPWLTWPVRAEGLSDSMGVRSETASEADSLVESVGLCGHLNWRGTVWGSSSWQPLFLELGVRYIRTPGNPCSRGFKDPL
jgi:hypothetical protein